MDDTISDLVDLLRRRSELLASLQERPREKRDLVADHDLPGRRSTGRSANWRRPTWSRTPTARTP
ncbi:hypothetical protein ACFQL4_10315 [Halosimplex aquaticum]